MALLDLLVTAKLGREADAVRTAEGWTRKAVMLIRRLPSEFLVGAAQAAPTNCPKFRPRASARGHFI